MPRLRVVLVAIGRRALEAFADLVLAIWDNLDAEAIVELILMLLFSW